MTSRKLALLFCAFVGVSFLLMGCDSPQQKETNFIKQGNTLFERGDYEKARLEYKNAAKISPTDAEPPYRVGLVDEAEGDLRNAFENFTVAEQQNKHFHPALLKIAQYFTGAEVYDEAQKRITSVLSEDPNDAEAHAQLASLLLHKKDLDTAEKEANTALENDASNISAYSVLAGIYSARDNNEKAVDTVNAGIAHNPNSLALMMLRVMLCEKMDDLPKVAEAYQAIFALKPEEAKYRIDLARIYIHENKLDEAEANFRDAIVALPDNWDLKRQLVVFLDEHWGEESAEKEILALIKAYPGNNNPQFWLADLYASHNYAARATALLDGLIAHEDPRHPALEARTQLAQIDMSLGQNDTAQNLVDIVLTKEPENAAALFIRANLAFDNGNYQGAVADLRTILRSAPNNQKSLQLLSESLLQQGHLDLAIDTLKKLADIDPANLAARARLAQLVDKNGDTKQALEMISQVTKTAPNLAVGWESAARIAIDAQDWAAAEMAIRTLDQLPGQHLTASFLQGQTLALNGKSADGIQKYSEVISADPTTPLADRALSAQFDTARKIGDLATEANYLESLTTKTPYVLSLLGECYSALGKKTESEAALDAAIAQNPTFQMPYIDRANLYVREHKLDEAIEVLKKGSHAAPADARAPMMEANLLSAKGRQSEAAGIYSDTLNRNPDMDAAANNLAEIIANYQYQDPVALEKAQHLAERFSASTNPLTLDTLAWVYYRQGNVSLAQTTIERAFAQKAPIPPELHYHYAAILISNGNKEHAHKELAQALVEGATYDGIEDAKKMAALP